MFKNWFGSVAIKTTVDSPKKEQRKLRTFKNFPSMENNSGWVISKENKIHALIIEECLDDNTCGGFTHRELALAVMDCLIENGWSPPKLTIEKSE